MTRRAARFAVAFIGMYVGHHVGDYLVQCGADAVGKRELPGAAGHAACARHVLSYTLTGAATLALAERVTGAGIRPGRAAAALAFSGVTHYFIDRGDLLERAADATGKGEFFRLGKPRAGMDDNPTFWTGGHAIDQALHIACIFLGALAAADRD